MRWNPRTVQVWLWLFAAALAVAAAVIGYVRHGDFDMMIVLPALVLAGIGITAALRGESESASTRHQAPPPR